MAGNFAGQAAQDSGGNAGTLYTGQATDVRAWLLDLSSREVTQRLDGIYAAVGERVAKGLPDGISLWADLSYSNLEFGGKGDSSQFSGDLQHATLGLEKQVNSSFAIGFTASNYEGDVNLDNASQGIKGTMSINGNNLNHYLLWSGKSSRFWATLGLGRGELDYMDRITGLAGSATRDSANTEMTMVAMGSEFDLAEYDNVELLGRIEAMSTSVKVKDVKNSIFDQQNLSVKGARAEFEAGWPMILDTGNLKPYLTLGYRWDGGAGPGGRVVEYGGGVSLHTGHITLDSSVRSQLNSKKGDFDIDSYNLSVSFDKDRDGKGMMLTMSQEMGADDFDPFTQNLATGFAGGYGQLPSGSRSEQDRINIEAGYGLVLQASTLTFTSRTSFNQGTQSEQSYGIVLDSIGSGAESADAGSQAIKPSRYELLISRKLSTAGNIDALLLKIEKLF